MKNESRLSAIYNMSLGFTPVIVAILLSEFIAVDIAVYTGAAIGVSFLSLYYFLHKPPAKHFILGTSTTILILFSIATLIMGSENEWPRHLLPLTLEMAITLPLLFLYMNKKRFLIWPGKNKDANGLKEQVRITAFTLSCIRIFFVLVVLHFAFITIGFIFARSLDNKYMWFMLHVAPLLVFSINILAGYIEIRMLRDMKVPEFVPVITSQGTVIGKVDKNLAGEYKNEHTHPIVRIAVVSHDMLFLSKRSMQRVIDKGKIDTPLETYLLFKEGIDSGVERLLKETFPHKWTMLHPKFSVKYKFRNEDTDRIVYLFILDLGTDDEILCDPKFENGKLWTFQQIELNLGQHYFSEMFENEYDHLNLIIETRGIYKES